MSSINPVSGNVPVQVTQAVTPKSAPPAAAGSTSADKLELSGLSGFLKTLQANNVRADKVASVREAIDKGTYETDDKLNVAVDRMLDDLK